MCNPIWRDGVAGWAGGIAGSRSKLEEAGDGVGGLRVEG